jgi:hypothetical protein
MLGPDMGLTKKFVASLDPLSNSSRLLLPNLKYFEYKGPVLCDCRTIVDMLARRWHLSDGKTSQSIFRVPKLGLANIFSTVRYHVNRCARRFDGRTSQSIPKLRLAEVLSTVRYRVTADVQEELRNLSEEGMLVRIESLVPTTVSTLVSSGVRS